MPSQLISNDAIEFLCAKNFLYRGQVYHKGDEFPGEEANNIETLVRARYVIPVVEDATSKPRHWHLDVRPRAEIEAKLSDDPPKQIVFETEPDSEEVVNLNTLTDPNREPEEEPEQVNPLPGPPEGFDQTEPEPQDDYAEEVVAPPPPEEEPDAPTPEPEPEAVPEGTIAEIKDWVGEDPARAQAALDAEKAGTNRSTLIAWLEDQVE